MQHQDAHDTEFTALGRMHPFIVRQYDPVGQPIHWRQMLNARSNDMNPL